MMKKNHQMFAVIGIYRGREDNLFWRRIGNGAEDGANPGIEAAGAEERGKGKGEKRGRERRRKRRKKRKRGEGS